MTKLRIALAQVNPTVGDIEGNVGICLEMARRSKEQGAHLLALPEMMVSGYPTEDLSLRRSFARACMRETRRLTRQLRDDGHGDLTVVVGTLAKGGESDQPIGTPKNAPRNAVWVLQGGKVVARYAKHHLPNYGVFDEHRIFVPGEDPCNIEVNGVNVSLAICEDLWRDSGPVDWARESDADLLLVINGSPYEEEKSDARLDLCQRQAARAQSMLAYVNMVGAQDELVFSGDSMVVNPAGDLLARAPMFDECLLFADLDMAAGTATPVTDAPLICDQATGSRQVYEALTVGLRDYVRKNGFKSVVLGLSGGIDSALVAAIAVDALGADNVHGVSMPSRYSSQHSKDDALAMGETTGLHVRTVPIEDVFAAFQGQLSLTGLSEENLQARIRGVILMGLSNQEGHLVLATGNKTELAVGYSTIYGDAVGGFAPIKDAAKTQVWELSKWRNAHAAEQGEVPPIPENSITKPPSAELRPDQVDSDSLPDYELLDAILNRYVEQDLGAEKIIDDGYEEGLVERVITMTDRAEYKRRQYPPGTKITLKAFGRDRRLPITSRWREHYE